tara:strand:+ start:232 stop:372 length:141 start_codon:yes stop_codon:yes gene_type:complete
MHLITYLSFNYKAVLNRVERMRYEGRITPYVSKYSLAALTITDTLP